MEPGEFLTRVEFGRLSDEEAAGYIEKVTTAQSQIPETDQERLLSFSVHVLDLLEWTLPPDEFDREVRGPIWDKLWDDPETILESLQQLVISPELTESERAEVRGRIEQAQAVVTHKRSLSEFEETSD